MGFFDFVKDAGAALFGGKKKVAPPPVPVEAGPRLDPELAAALEKYVGDLGLNVTELSIRVEDDTAIVHGKVPTQQDLEKVVLAVGNNKGVARVDERLEIAAPPEPPAVFYTVVKGDNLSKIAKHHYGSANKYMVIFEANKPMLQHPDKIYPGQVLRIPPQA